MRRLSIVFALMAGLSGSLEAQAAGDRALGEYLSSACVSCHRPDGQSTATPSNTAIPSIIGWPNDQFIAIVQAYRSKVREHQIMNSLASNLSDADIEALAEYFGSLSRQ